jgi:hypothetical protein
LKLHHGLAPEHTAAAEITDNEEPDLLSDLSVFCRCFPFGVMTGDDYVL